MWRDIKVIWIEIHVTKTFVDLLWLVSQLKDKISQVCRTVLLKIFLAMIRNLIYSFLVDLGLGLLKYFTMGLSNTNISCLILLDVVDRFLLVTIVKYRRKEAERKEKKIKMVTRSLHSLNLETFQFMLLLAQSSVKPKRLITSHLDKILVLR